MPEGASPFKFKAFVSYSHKDREWGEWLHKAIESYRVPPRIVGTTGRDGPLPPKLFPVFRDREELSSSSDLNAQIKIALDESAYLIVVCSPNAASSRWVNEEILAFKRMGREDRILALIVEGEPNASDPSLECFPDGLKFKLGAGGELSSTPTEPIAADAREEGDGKENAKLKLIAGLLGIGYDALKQREREARRARTRVQASIAAAVAAAFLGVFIYYSVARTWDAVAGQLIAEARGSLSQRDYARAEITAADAMTYRDTAETRELLLTARLGGIRSVARSGTKTSSELNVFSRDGQVVAAVLQSAVNAPYSVSIISPDGGQELWRVELPASAGMPDSIAFSEQANEERQVAIAWPESDATVFRVGVWRLHDGKPVAGFRELTTGTDVGRHTKRVPSMAFDPKKSWIVTSGEDGKLCLWDLSPDKPIVIWEQANTHYPDVHGVAFNSDGSLLASGGGDYLAKVWKAADMAGTAYDPNAPYKAHEIEPLYTLSGHSDSVFVVAFSPNGHRLASGGYDRTIRIWDFDLTLKDAEQKPQPQTVATLSGHEGTVLALSYSDDGKLLTSGASDETARLWDASVGRLLDTFKPEDGVVRSVTSPKFEDHVHIGGEHGWSIWSVRGGSLVTRLWAGGATIGAIAFDPTGQYLAVGGSGDDGKLRVWDQSYRLVQVLDPQSAGDYVNGIAFSGDGHWLAAAGGNEVIHVWDRANKWSIVQPANKDTLHHDGPIWGLCFDPRGRWLASSNESHSAPQNVRIKRWSVTDWSLKDESERLEDQVYALGCDASGDRIVSGDSRARVTVRDTTRLSAVDKTINVKRGEVNVWSVALAESPHSILSGNSDGHVYRWTPDDSAWAGSNKGEKISTSADEAKINPTINSVAYNGAHGWVAAGGVGPSVQLYDIKDLHAIRSIRGHDGTVWWVTFDPQGSRLAYGGLDGIVRIIDIEAMLRTDNDSPDKLYRESRETTGLSVEDGKIVEWASK